MAPLSLFGTPILYFLIRLLFKFVLKVFYSSIVIENPQFVPPDGVPCILCANHSNSLTDALIVITSIPLSKRNWVRMTAKSTLFGLKTFSSWLIESVGTLPVKRPKDFNNKVDNTAVFEKLNLALEDNGDMVCMFPEGISHYSPGIAPLKSGVARMTSDLLRRNKHNPDFKLVLLTCSITYLHREAFRSDVLVSFNPPIELNIKEHYGLFSGAVTSPQQAFTAVMQPASSSLEKGSAAKIESVNGNHMENSSLNLSPSNPNLSLPPPVLDGVKQLTLLMHEQIRQGTIDSPDFRTVRIANTARRLYAPLGTTMTLGDHVHLTQRFVDVFARQSLPASLPSVSADALYSPLPVPPIPMTPSKVKSRSSGSGTASVTNSTVPSTTTPAPTTMVLPLGTSTQVEARSTALDYFSAKEQSEAEKETRSTVTDEEIEQLKEDLHAYQDLLNHIGLKDDRVRQTPPVKRILYKRLAVRLLGVLFLFILSAPGLIFWSPIFATAGFFGWRTGSSGRLEDVWDEVAHTKLIYGLLSGCIVWLITIIATFPFSGLTVIIFPIFMWFSLRWLEDCLSSLRAAIALISMLAIGKKRLREIRRMRQLLVERVTRVAVERAELPDDVEVFVKDAAAKERRNREKGGKVGRLGYFSLRRRRKKDYNEIMHLWDKSEYAT